MNLAERGLLRGSSLFNKNRSKKSDKKPAVKSCLEERTYMVSIRVFFCIARLAWPALVITILVYCWLAVGSLSSGHHVSLRHQGPTTSVRERENTTIICTRQDDSKEKNNSILCESHGNTAITKENNSDQHLNVTLSDLNVANENENGSYFTNPIDKHDYKYIHNPESLCKKNTTEPKQIFLLMIMSAPEKVGRRNIIRSTYGNEKDWEAFANRDWTVLTVFLLGKTNNATLQMDIDKESDLHGDIAQEDFVDCYDNLTMKTVMGLKWVTNHCRHATYVFKFDDTAVIIQNNLYTALIDVPTTTWAAGHVHLDGQVFHNTDDEYYISKDFYAFPTYPPYLDGQGYVLSTDLVEAIYNVAITTPLFPWEDVFIGMCLQKLGVVPTNFKNFVK